MGNIAIVDMSEVTITEYRPTGHLRWSRSGRLMQQVLVTTRFVRKDPEARYDWIDVPTEADQPGEPS